MLFAFGGKDSALHNPENFSENSIVYVSTHDNNTVRGWFEKEAQPAQKKKLFEFIGGKIPVSQIPRELIRLAEKTVSDIVIIQMQDILGLDEKGRMNRPATIKGNWQWRLEKGQIEKTMATKLKEITKLSGRN